jgi:hypothetical protein
MRYVLLIYASEADIAKMTPDEREAVMRAHGAFAEDTQKHGILTGGAALQSIRTAHSRRPKNSLAVSISSTARIWTKRSAWQSGFRRRALALSKSARSWSRSQITSSKEFDHAQDG